MRSDRYSDMARVCIGLRMTPREYWELTVAEHQALTEEFNRAQKKR